MKTLLSRSIANTACFITYVSAAMIVLSAIAIVHAVTFTFHTLSSTPFWDFWNWLADYKSYAEGHYSFDDLLKPHNEHRIVTTRLILFVDAIIFHMSGRFAAAINLGVLCGVGALLGGLEQSSRSSSVFSLAVITIFPAFMLSICQWPNLSMPFQVQHGLLCIGIVGAAASIAMAARKGRTRRSGVAFMVVAGLCAWVAVFSMAGGLIALPVLVVQLVLSRAPIRSTIIFTLIAAAAAALFLIGYYPIRAVPLTLQTDPATLRRLFLFASGFIGCPLYPFGKLPYFVGLLGLNLFAAEASLVLFWLLTGRRHIREEALAFLAIGGAIVLMAAAAAVSRLGLGLGEAVQPRYCTMALLFWCSLGGLSSVLSRTIAPNLCLLPAVTAPVLACAGVILVSLNFTARYIDDGRAFAGMLNSEAEAMRQNVLVSSLFKQTFYGSQAEAASRIRFLQDEHLSVFAGDATAMPSPALLSTVELGGTSNQACEGEIELVYRLDASRGVLRLWLGSTTSRRTADWVALLTPRNALEVILPATAYRHKVGPRPNVIRLAYEVYTGLTLPKPGEDGEVILHAAGLFDGRPDLTCRFATPIRFPPLRVQTVESMGPATTILSAPASLTAGGFQENAVSKWVRLIAPWQNEPFYTSVQASEPNGAALSFSLAPDGADAAMPFATGAQVKNQVLSVAFKDGKTIALPVPNDTQEAAWRILTVPHEMIAQHGGGSMAVSASNHGADWNYWLAVAAPEAVTLNPDWAKLY